MSSAPSIEARTPWPDLLEAMEWVSEMDWTRLMLEEPWLRLAGAVSEELVVERIREGGERQRLMRRSKPDDEFLIVN